jgi:hypothetical protein
LSAGVSRKDLHRFAMKNQHFILCGLGRVGASVLEYLRAAKCSVVVID